MSGVAIDLAGVEAFRRNFREAIINLANAVREGVALREEQIPFGGQSPSGEIVAARGAFCEAVNAHHANLWLHTSNAEYLNNQLAIAADEYRRGDERAAARIAAWAHADPPAASDSAHPPISGYATDLGLAAPPVKYSVPAPHSTNWQAYNVPRHASILHNEGSLAAYATALMFGRIASYLDEYQMRMRTLRQELAKAWSPQKSTAAEAYQRRLGEHIVEVAHDASCAAITANAVHSLIDTLVQARNDVDKFHQQWKKVTTDWKPESWYSEADRVNTQSGTRMTEADQGIRDWRLNLITPVTAASLTSSSPVPTGPGGAGAGGAGAGPIGVGGHEQRGALAAVGGGAIGVAMVPPVPGMNPVTGPALAGAPQRVPVSSTNPPSMLPIPPGVSPQAPAGGAWILPGPGAGARGQLVPMPQKPQVPSPAGTNRYTSNQRPGVRSATVASNGGNPTIGDLPESSVGSAATSRGKSKRLSAVGSQQWLVRQGVPPIIGKPAHGEKGPDKDTAAGTKGTSADAPATSRDKGKRPSAVGSQQWPVRQGVPPIIDEPAHDETSPVEEMAAGLVGKNVIGFDNWFANTATPWDKDD